MSGDFIDFSTVRRALVVKLRHHGDVLLTSPVFTVLKNHVPHIEVDALVYADTAEMLSGHPAISQLHLIDRGWKKQGALFALHQEWKLLRTLRRREYDLLVHLTENPRGGWLAYLLGATFSVVRDYSPRRGRLWHSHFSHRYRIPARPRHTVEVHLDALRRIGIQPQADERRLVLVPGPEAEAFASDQLRHHGLVPKKYIHVHPTSRWMFKSWTVDGYVELINRLQGAGEQILMTAAPDRSELRFVEKITSRIRQPVINLSGELTLKQLAALIGRAKGFIGADSVPMHMAAAMQTPVVALFGPSGENEWGPWMVNSRVVSSADHPCRPCGLDGCGQGKVSDCLTSIRVEQVLEAVHQVVT